ncbi:MAG: hydroxymethylbilane synthase [Proteobacteria bacterium]|nr:hydroxymethylbilane synthase [Pseudomonadota bacterium]
MNVRIATRNSPLALWQAEYVKNRLLNETACTSVELVAMTTQGDRLLETSLAKLGGKGLFLKELETALLDDRADIAVHSMKDVPVEIPDGLSITTVCAREVSEDAFISNSYHKLTELPSGAIVGTSSLRRATQLMFRYPEIEIKPLRGNVNTRLSKLDDGQFDAIILATAGLNRLDMSERVREVIDASVSVPAIGQGIVGVESRENNQRMIELLRSLHDDQAWDCLALERAVGKVLGASCQAPVAAHAKITIGGQLEAVARVGSIDASVLLESTIAGARTDAEQLGEALARDLLSKGAAKLLEAFAA